MTFSRIGKGTVCGGRLIVDVIFGVIPQVNDQNTIIVLHGL